MRTIAKQPVLSKIDYDIILKLLQSHEARALYNRLDAEGLLTELKKATIVKDNEMPVDVVRLNSIIELKDKKEDKLLQLTLVTPKQANIKEKKISVMSPVGIALIGCYKGQEVKWKVPTGKKHFLIMDVQHYQASIAKEVNIQFA